MSGSEIKKNGITVKENYAPSLERLEVKNTFLRTFVSDMKNFFKKEFSHNVISVFFLLDKQ